MAESQHRAHLNMMRNRVVQALLDPQTTDPAAPAEAQIWTNTTTNRLMIRLGGIDLPVAFVGDIEANAVTGALWDAQSVVVAVSDDTPVAVVVPEGGVVGRLTGGNVGPITGAELKTMLSIPAGTIATESVVDQKITAIFNGLDTALDTMAEITAAIQDNDTGIDGLLAAIAAKTSKYPLNIGDGTATTYTVGHNLGTMDVVVSSRLVSDDSPIVLDWKPVSNTAIEVSFNDAPTLDEIRVVVVG